MFTVFTVNSAVLEVVVVYRNLTLPTGHILICLHTQIACMLPTSSTLMMMVVTDNILEVAFGAKIGATEFMTRNEAREMGGHAVGKRLG
jgi:hypothetical protein